MNIALEDMKSLDHSSQVCLVSELFCGNMLLKSYIWVMNHKKQPISRDDFFLIVAMSIWDSNILGLFIFSSADPFSDCSIFVGIKWLFF